MSLTKYLEDVCESKSNCALYFTLAPILFILTSLFICIGNSITIVAVAKTRKLQTLPNMYIVSLACADFISGLYVFNLTFLHLEKTHDTVGHTKPFCLFLYIMFVLGSVSSSFSIVFIALDRYIYIVHPYKYPCIVTSVRTKRLIGGSWLVSAAVAVGVIHFNKYDEVGECSFVHVLHHGYQLSTQAFLFFLTFITVAVLYIKIIIVALKQRNAIAAAQSRTRDSWRQNIRTIRILVLICGIYVFCWMPSHVLVCVAIATEKVQNILSFTFLLGTLNSGVNFIIYPLMNKDFRSAFTSLLCCWKRIKITPVRSAQDADLGMDSQQRDQGPV